MECNVSCKVSPECWSKLSAKLSAKLSQTVSTLKRRCRPLRPTFKKCIVALLVSTVIYNEFLCYWLAARSWHRIYYNGVRVLFVADPQLVGFNDQAILRPLSRLDCDRYISKTFSYAVSHVDPDVIVFMGDLLDEGSTATDEEYETYVARFNSVFATDREGIRRVVIPGDNDVGGEGSERKTEQKIQRFNKHFVPNRQDKTTANSWVQVKDINFMTLNLDDQDRTIDENYISDLAKLAPAESIAQESTDNVILNRFEMMRRHDRRKESKVNVILNHFEMMRRHDIRPLLTKFNTDVIFTAHSHHAMVYTCPGCRHGKQEVRVDRWNKREFNSFSFKRDGSLFEIGIPTCSYRMGVPQMGYGYAVMYGDRMDFTILWLPSRYKHLAAYGVVLVVVAVLLLGRCLSMVLCRPKRQPSPRPALLPLYS
jgi:predicted MPP superfamily phosphohydrolase